MKKGTEPDVKLARSELENTVTNLKSIEHIEHIANKVLSYANAVIYRRAKATCASFVHPDESKSICYIVYQDEVGEYLADIFLLVGDLYDLCLTPRLYIPEKATLAELNIFGFVNDFETEVLPKTILLKSYDIKKVYYYEWDKSSSKYGRWNMIDKIRTLTNDLSNPIAIDEYKNALLEKRNGVLTIQDLAYLKQIKCILD